MLQPRRSRCFEMPTTVGCFPDTMPYPFDGPPECFSGLKATQVQRTQSHPLGGVACPTAGCATFHLGDNGLVDTHKPTEFGLVSDV